MADRGRVLIVERLIPDDRPQPCQYCSAT